MNIIIRTFLTKLYLVLVFLKGSTILFAQGSSDHTIEELYDLVDKAPKKVIQIIDTLLVSKNITSAHEKTQYYMIQSDAYYYDENIYQSTSTLHNALALMPEDFPPLKKIEVYNNLGQNLSTLGKTDSAIFYYQQGLTAAKEHKDSIETSNLYYNIGVEYIATSSYKKGLEYLDSSYLLALEIKYSTGISSSLRMIGSMKEAHYDQEGAIETYKTALQYTSSEDPMLVCMLYIDIGGVFMYKNILDSASYYADLATTCFDDKEDKTTLSYLYLLKAQIARDLGDTSQAIDWLNKSMQWAKAMGDMRAFFTTQLLDLEINPQNRTIPTIERLLNDEWVDVYPDKLIFLYELYAQLLDNAGEDKKAKEVLLQLLKLQRKRMNEENQRVIQGQAVRYELFEQEKALELFKINYELTQFKWRSYFIIVIFLAVMILGGYYLYYKRRFFLKEQEKLKQEKELLEKLFQVESQALRAQMNPHFIFNALNSIKGLVVTQQNKKAALYISKFSKLVRNVLDSSRAQYITLEKEIATLETYIQLEKMRFRDDFDYKIVLHTDVISSEIMILPTLIQPFVENAIWHGFKQNKRPNKLEISIAKDAHWLHICIKDNGIGRKQQKEKNSILKSHQSHGITITQSRIDAYNVNDKTGSVTYHDLKDSKNNPIGTNVLLKLPIQYRP